ncbi:hypothetical protein SBADM41S_07623 [Streptomyces badius]
MAQRGARVPEPASRWSAARSALITIPSMPNGSAARREPMASTRAWTSSTVAARTGATSVPAAVCTPRRATYDRTSLWGSSARVSPSSPESGNGSAP